MDVFGDFEDFVEGFEGGEEGGGLSGVDGVEVVVGGRVPVGLGLGGQGVHDLARVHFAGQLRLFWYEWLGVMRWPW